MTVPDLFQYSCSSILLISLITISVIVFFRKERMSQLAGFFALKSIIIYGLALTAVVLRLISSIIWLPAYLMLEVFLFFVIILQFKDLYNKSSKLPWLIAGCDTIRCGILFFLAIGEFFVYTLTTSQGFWISSVVIVYSITLALIGAFLGVIRRKKTQVV